MKIDKTLKPAALAGALKRFWGLSGSKILDLDRTYDPARGAPVFTAAGRYTSRGWTEWTQGFQYGSELLQYDATGDVDFLHLGRRHTVERMAPHLTHNGVHDHGFNNVSTYGNLRRLMLQGRFPADAWELRFYELALKVSGAVQASRWTPLPDGGFIHSFNGPHSLFADTIRSLRSLALAHRLGHVLQAENDRRISLLDRLVQHAAATARYTVYYGEGRDACDVRGRVAHESVFNTTDGAYRCPNSQQGYSPFSTWTRGLAWVILGFAEQLEFIETVPAADFKAVGGKRKVRELFRRAACATADFYLDNCAADGIPYWDTGAPGLARLGDWRSRPADPFNDHEPVDSSAAAIAAQGLLRLGRVSSFRFQVSSAGKAAKPSGTPLETRNLKRETPYFQAGLTILRTLLGEPYLSTKARHQGLLLHSVYHRPNGWDFIPRGRTIPCGESSMWGDYHVRELALLVQRMIEGGPWLTFYGE